MKVLKSKILQTLFNMMLRLSINFGFIFFLLKSTFCYLLKILKKQLHHIQNTCFQEMISNIQEDVKNLNHPNYIFIF